MAQAVYDEHPLQMYLNGESALHLQRIWRVLKVTVELGEASKLMPGGSADFLPQDDEFDALSDEHTAVPREPSWILDIFEVSFNCTRGLLHRLGRLATVLFVMVDPIWSGKLNVLQILSNLFTTRFSQQPSPFIERFKYDVISSSLLSSSLSASRRPSSPCIPGQLRSKSRSRSLDYNQPPLPQDANIKTNQYSDVTTRYNHGLLVLAVAAFGAGFYLLSALVFGAAYIQATSEGTQRHDMAPVSIQSAVLAQTGLSRQTKTMQSLEELISASDVWDSVIHDAIHQLENEERR
ncbi:hypothetical protein PTI98_008082 [Pleurotus ostreatus]|nr:hypothetical protein PTI98_008082 [Pleurotus ostreatus]